MNKTELSISKNLASYAVYKELYDSKKDNYDIIIEFIKSSIKTKNLLRFTAQDIYLNLKEDFDFEIPESIIKTALRRLGAKRSEGYYSISYDANSENLIVDNKQEKIIENNEHIIANLYSYIEKKSNKTLTQNDKDEISQSFSSFLLNENGFENKFYEDISSFIISNQNNLDFKKQLNIIREGVILYSGVRYGEITQKRKELVDDLVIYLDTEILFHFAGYNGELYKSLFEDFYKLVKEINSSKRKIFFKYFKTTEDEINAYFKKAEYLLDKPTKIDPSKTAMNSIIDGCSKGSDIISKKTSFFKLLETYNIDIDTIENYITDNTYEYNLISQDLLQDLERNTPYEEYEINNSLNKLNSINILRAEKYNNSFYNIGYILLSGNSKIFKIAWNQYLKIKGEVPLVTHLDFLINKFWLKLNKGFGNTNFPKIFDVITKAQIVLSNNINNNVHKKYSELQQLVQNGKIDKDEIIDTIINLKSEVKQPEEISQESLSDILDTLSIKDIEKYKYEKDKLKKKAVKSEEENTKLKDDIKSIRELTEEQKKELLESKNSELEALKKLKKIADENSSKQINRYKTIWINLIIVYYVCFFIFIYKLEWNTMEQWVWILGSALPIATSFLYTIVYERKFDILNHLSNKREEYIQREYKILELNVSKLSQLETDVQNIQQNIALNR